MSLPSAIHDATPPAPAPPIADARLYVCTDSRRERGDFAEFLRAAYAGGVDIIQLRDKSLEAAEELELLAVLRGVAEECGRLWAVNDRADIARLSGAPVFHVGQKDLPLPAARSLVGPSVAIGLSSHDPAQATAAAANPEAGYFCVGPLWATPTKPGRSAVGLGLVEHAASLGTAKPWFAIGGVDLTNVDAVVAAGASRIVVVRAVTDADDPTAAAQELLSRLPALG
ncbi:MULTISPECIES: thiamine phosphate synthase [unclassified Arthrobacter]|uniref:thiamine phosphate synthase n=1 Tax=unclassified Arthrobacter TaxID=235627 RepID=UPI00159E1EC4|nr:MULTISPECIES: thiamine phosphate synthase [unclassified Arthrobacter]MCQ9165366.1 thiamine phosphate synthase [Arthrobacter sp. STN4]NVM99616.1 thiamine phosphate synthase [Arthrobacter sp. SDTb3-6]